MARQPFRGGRMVRRAVKASRRRKAASSVAARKRRGTARGRSSTGY